MWIRWPRAEWLCAGMLLTLAGPLWAWQLRSEPDDSVQLWTTHSTHHSYQMVRAETVVTAPIFRLLHLLQDAKRQHQWLPYTHQVEVLQQPAPEQTLVRFESESRWPFAARDAVTLFVVSQPQADSIRIDMLNRPDAAPVRAGVERIQQAEGHWLLTALAGCTTHVRYEAGNHWGGNVPQWLVDRINRRVTATALRNLQQWAPRQTLANTTPTFLQPVPAHADCD